MNLQIPGSLVAGVMLALCAFTQHAHAQASYPAKTVRVIVGFPPGAGVDITARIFAQKFSEAWGQPVIVENVVGAGGSVGVARVAKAIPDGYTLVFAANGALTIAPSLQSNLPYDPRRDLAPISLAVMVPSIIAVNNEVPARTFQDLIALAKSKPGKLSYSTPGNGTPQHVGGESLKALAGVDIVHVPYRGAVFTDVIGGRVTIAWQNTAAILPIIRDGKLRGLAVTSLRRSPNVPELPTVSESGFPGFESISWFAFLAPAATPKPVVDKVHRETLSVLAQPEMRPRFAQLGAELVGSSPDQLAATIKSDIDKWAKVIKDAGITASE